MVTIRRQPTRQTQMPPLAECLSDFCPAGACLARTARINFHQQPTSIFRFVGKLGDERRPSGVVNTLGKPPLGQPLYIQILNSDQPVFVDQRATQFVMKVAALVADSDMRSLKYLDRLTPSARTLLATRHTPLSKKSLALERIIPDV